MNASYRQDALIFVAGGVNGALVMLLAVSGWATITTQWWAACLAAAYVATGFATLTPVRRALDGTVRSRPARAMLTAPVAFVWPTMLFVIYVRTRP